MPVHLPSCFAVLIGMAWAQLLPGSMIPQDQPVPCGPEDVKHTVSKHKEKPMPEASSTSSLMYIIKTGANSYLQAKFSVDGDWKAVVPKDTYTFFEVQPGPRRLCYTSPFPHFVRFFLTVEPGKTYYIQADHPYSFGGGRPPNLVEISRDRAKELIAKRAYVTFQVER